MPLAQARALFVSEAARVEPYDTARDRVALERLAVWAHRLSPVVAVDDAHEEPDGLLLDVTGCELVWGGEQRMIHAATHGLARLGLCAQVAIGPTFGSAWAVARFGGEEQRIVAADGARGVLAPLPIAALRVDPQTVSQLAQVGVKRIGELLELPRSALPARFGPELLLRLDQAVGQAMEMIDPVRPVPPAVVERVFDGPTDRVEVIELAVRDLLGRVAQELARRGCGARSIGVELVRSDLEPERLAVTLGRPSRDAKHLWQLLAPKLERAHLGFGVEVVRVCVRSADRIRHEQAECAGASGDVSRAESDRAWGGLVDTLSNRLGAARVMCAIIRASHLPERAVVMRRASDDLCRVEAGVVITDRPTVLFERPVPAEVVALTPDGPVHRVMWNGEDLAVSACFGPERISGEWWRAPPSEAGRTRDYFTVRDDGGRWLWLARGIESGRWYVHGVWA